MSNLVVVLCWNGMGDKACILIWRKLPTLTRPRPTIYYIV